MTACCQEDAGGALSTACQGKAYPALDTVQLMSRYAKLRKVPERFKGLPADPNEAISILCEMQAEAASKAEAKEVIDEIVYRVFFLLPLHAKKHAGKIFLRLPHSVFEDALQNMAVNVVVAIKKFNPSMGTKFSNYLLMYLQDGLFKAIRNSNVVSPTASRKKNVAALEVVAPDPYDTDQDSSGPVQVLQGAVSVAKGQVEFDDGAMLDLDASYATEHIDHADLLYENEVLHWLRYALDAKNGVLTPDEALTVRHHFGVFGCSKLRLKDIAAIRKGQGKGHAATRIFQIEKEALKKLQAFFAEVGLEYQMVR